MHYVLMYELADDYMQRRKEDGDEHLRLLWESYDRGELVLGGALIEPVDGGLYVFKGDSAAVAEEFARRDSYVRRGFVKSWKVRPWMTVAGDLAARPMRPK
jgi:uncharacterized protein YciI